VRFALSLSLIAVGLVGRSVLDKLLALEGGAELVVLWAQVSSLFEVVVGVVASGVGAGLVVYVARSKRKETQLGHLSEALHVGLRLSVPVVVVLATGSWLFNDFISGGKLSPWVMAVAVASGWLGIVPMLISNYWLGQHRHGLMLSMASAQALLVAGAAIVFEGEGVLAWVVIAQSIPAIVLFWLGGAWRRRPERRPHPLRRYILPGLSIGILSPLSMLVVRSVVGDSLSWHDAGVLQALFRLADWVCTIAGGLLTLLYLAPLSAARTPADLSVAVRSAAKAMLLPAAAAFVALFLLHRPLLAALYDSSIQASDTAAALFFAGSLVRIASWIPLYALYARRRTREIAIGEVLSLPLFALLVVTAGRSITLELAGAMWLAAYAVYGAYNLRASHREA
jgi:O-antigen/teichoic acid export membrane protein